MAKDAAKAAAEEPTADLAVAAAKAAEKLKADVRRGIRDVSPDSLQLGSSTYENSVFYVLQCI